MTSSLCVFAGIPATNLALYWRIRFSVGDPAALIIERDGTEHRSSTLIIRDIEVERAKLHARADHVFSPAEFTPLGGLSIDRETATAQSLAEFVRRRGAKRVTCDRTLPALYWHILNQAGIEVECDPNLGVFERRAKDAQEIRWIREAQRITEQAVEMACRTIAHASVGGDGLLQHAGATLTTERVRAILDGWLIERAYENPTSIVASGAVGADCHDHGHGPIRSGEFVIVDVFPRCRETKYNGDCTRTVVHGQASERQLAMHDAVVEAKRAAIAAIRVGATGDAVHAATKQVMQQAGFEMGLPERGSRGWCRMTHGTGHGVGLEVHEPPLLTDGGVALVEGDVLTVEPGLYADGLGGIRVEDMVVVTSNGCDNFNSIQESLDWR
ncbi:MAG: Xaa-Pro peptidase family protein [Planctomycetota bacterium]|nr:Xaa-Pro peptidase family protein [Planctomycetota bacterium]